MSCPFKEELKAGTIVCDSGPKGSSIPQCPNEIFNVCQEEAHHAAVNELVGSNNLLSGFKVAEFKRL